MAVTVGLDFGAYSTKIYIKNKGLVLCEPTIAAVDPKGNVIAVGTEALLIRGRAPGTVTVRRPIAGNNITDFNLAAETLDRFLEIAAPRANKHVFVAAKYGFGSKNREMLVNALQDCHTGKIEMVEAPVAALRGSGFAMASDTVSSFGGTIICDIGSGSIEASYIRNGELLRSDCRPGGGEAADSAIITFLKQKYGIAITSTNARELKHSLDLTATASPTATVTGLDGSTGMPRRLTINIEELYEPCSAQIDGVVDAIKTSIANLPYQAASQSTFDRIILVGGGAKLPGIAEYVSEAIDGEILVPDDPLNCTVAGLGALIENKMRA